MAHYGRGFLVHCSPRSDNLIAWNDRPPKYDLREWSPDGQTMGKGVTLTKEEIKALRELLATLEL